MATDRETESITGGLTGSAPAPNMTASPAATDLSVRPGDCLGRYTVREPIGRGKSFIGNLPFH